MERRRKEDPPQVTILPPTEDGKIYFYFSKDVLLRNDLKSLNSTNEGADILEISYKPSFETNNFLADRNEEENKFSWYTLEVTPRMLVLQADFDRPEFVTPEK